MFAFQTDYFYDYLFSLQGERGNAGQNGKKGAAGRRVSARANSC